MQPPSPPITFKLVTSHVKYGPSQARLSQRAQDGRRGPSFRRWSQGYRCPADTPIEAAVGASPAVDSPLAAPKTATPTAEEPTYFSVRSSSAYSTARRLLAVGQFEDALALIEAAITATRAALPVHPSGDEIDELHPALAPLHYLYGTTLLYTVEESDDMVNGAAASAQGAGAGPAANEEMAEDLQIAWENLDLAHTIMDCRRLVGTKERELATFTTTDTTASSAAATTASEEADNARTLLLDLSQIHLRLADLQKANSSYKECLADYARALELRHAVLGPYDRKVADVHYQLGVVCMTRAAEGGAGGEGGGGEGGTGAASAAASSGLLPPGAEDGILGMMVEAASEAAAEAQAETKPSPADCHHLRERSFLHYLACAQCFGGCLAKLCGIEEEKQIEDAVGKIVQVAVEGPAAGRLDDEGDKKMPAVAVEGEQKKMGGADEQEDGGDDKKHEHQTYADASQTLAGIRARCAELATNANAKKPASSSATAANTTAEDREAEVADLLSLLDELQETIDSQEEDLRGVHEVQEMKTKIEEEVKAADANPFGTATSSGAAAATSVSADGSVTTIGFGQPSATTAATAAAVAAGAAASSASAGEPARPMMVVKKKKKRAALAPAGGSGAAAKPASEADAKRAKTE